MKRISALFQAAIFINVLLVFGSCTSDYFYLESALMSAGSNRGELERVLGHYSENPADSLKYRAACFLIENMPYHYSYADTILLNQYYDEVDSVMALAKGKSNEIIDSLYDSVTQKYAKYNLATVPDIMILDADYLIKNIDDAFAVWGKNTWSEHVDFDDFCELILPYKVGDGQTLDDWRKYCYERYDESLADRDRCAVFINNPYIACNLVNENLRKAMNPAINGKKVLPVRRIRTLAHIGWGTCIDYSFMAQAVMMAKGIPCAIDFTPQWPFRSQGHTWNVLKERTGHLTVFEGAGEAVGSPHKKDHKMAKVYRRTYSINKVIEDLLKKEKSAPEIFITPFVKDVTDEYMETVDLNLKPDVRTEHKYAYLALFDNLKWQPVALGTLSRNEMVFDKVGKDAVYLPVVWEDTCAKAIHDPFILDINGNVRVLTPNEKKHCKLRLYKKHPYLPHTYGEAYRMRKAKIQASNDPEFKNMVTVHTYHTIENDISIPDSCGYEYRYWRYFSGDYGFVNVAELAFFERDSLHSTEGKIIGTPGAYRPEPEYRKEAVFDGDILTYFDAPTPSDSWVGMDFGHPVDIARVTCIMRGDGNEIEIGNEYELCYWKNGDWVSLGKKIADDIFLEYDDCPSNALFVLHNRTKGIEERVFTYEDDRQVWW